MTDEPQAGSHSGSGEEPLDPAKAELIWRYVDRLNAGEALDLEEIAREHPDIAPELRRQLLAFRDLVRDPEEDRPLGVLGDFQLLRRLGRGGMGIVYEAWQGSMERRVALKVLPAGVAANQDACTRFLREARAAGKLRHPNVVAVHGMGVEGGTPYYAMEYVDGETLAQVLARRKSLEEVTAEACFEIAGLFAQAADGLQHAHANGIVHRDVKPSNLILDRQRQLKVLDFGLAHWEGQLSLTLTGDVLGTPLYMSPEQARARKIPIDHRTDVYSLGATLYEVLTGQPPFRGKDHQDTLSQIITRDAPSPRRLNPRIPRDLETVLLKCLRKEAADRFGTAEALAQDLRRFVRGDPIEARPLAGWERLTRSAWRERRRLGALAAAVGFSLLIGFFLWERGLESKRRQLALYEHKVEHAVMKTELSRMSIQSVFDPMLGAFNPSPFSMQDLEVEGHSGFLDPLEEARKELDEAIALFPSLPHAYYHRARLSFIREGPAGARSDLERALLRDPEHPAAQVFKAILQVVSEQPGQEVDSAPRVIFTGDVASLLFEASFSMAKQRWKTAIQAFERLEFLDQSRDAASEQVYPGQRLEARLGKAVAAFEAGDYLRALMAFSEVKALWPEFHEIDLSRAKTLFLYGEEGRAGSLFQEIHERSRAGGDVAYEVMLFYGRRNRPEKALEWARLLAREDVSERYRAYYLCVLRSWSAAVDAARKAIELNSQNFYAHADLAWALEAMGETDQASAHYQEALRIGQGFSYPHLAMAWSHLARGNPQGAVAELRVASRIDPSNLQIRIDLGRHLTDIGAIEESKQVLAAILDTEPHSIWALGNLGRALVTEGDCEGAIVIAERGLAIDPQNGWLHNLMGWALRDLGRLEEAKVSFRRSIASAPPNVLRHTYVNLGRLFLDFEGNSSAAIELLKEGVRVFPHDTPLLELLGDAYLKEGSIGGALTSFREAVEHNINMSLVTPYAKLAELLERPEISEFGVETERLCALLERTLARREIHPALPLVLGSLVPGLLADPKQGLRILRRGLETFGDFLTDSILESRRSSFPGTEAELLGMFRRLDENPSQAVYLEGRLLARAGNHQEAADKFLEILENSAVELAPLLRLAECQRVLGDPVSAEENLRETPIIGTRYDRDILELWAVLCLLDLDQSPAELLRKYPWPAEGYAGDLRWLLERLEAGEAVRINCGGKEYRDSEGKLWSGDRFFIGGVPGGYGGGEIELTASDALYRSHRWFPEERPSRAAYRIPLPRGEYGVTLHFAETFFRLPERRIFDIWIDNRPVHEAYEPFADGFATAQAKPFSIAVWSGLLEIKFVARVNHPMVSAIEVERID